MPKYFTYLSSNNVPANALQRQALAVLQAESNWVINDPDTFVDVLKRKIDGLNAENPRCTPLRVGTYGIDKFKQIGVSLGSHFTVGFYISISSKTEIKMPRKCDTCKHFRILYGDRCSNREIAQIANRTIDTRLDTARDICDRESNGIFVYFEPKQPSAGVACYGPTVSPVSEPEVVATGSAVMTTQPERALKAAA